MEELALRELTKEVNNVSDSYKKNAFCSYSGNKQNKQIRNRLTRRRSKQYINTCTDWDSFSLPKFDWIEDFWSDYDSCYCRHNVPALNQCQIEAQRYNAWREDYAERIFGFDGVHLKHCNCYTNKRGKWWKAKRK